MSAVSEKKLELGEFAHNVKHYVMIVEELLRVVRSGSEETRERASSKMEKALHRLLQETNAVLLADKDDAGLLNISPLPISLAEVTEDSLAEFRPLFEASNIHVEKSLPVSVPASSIDPALFPHVIQNLLDNALKYSEPGGTVKVNVSVHEPTVILEVENGGNVFSQEEVRHLFERNFRATNALHVPGNGLGLYLVRRIVERHGGETAAEIQPDGSVKFTVKLPMEGSDGRKAS